MSVEPAPAFTPPASTPTFTPPASAGSGAAATTTQSTRRSWTPWEDQTLRNRVAQFGDARGTQRRWGVIAQAIPGRTAKACRKRWLHSLDPSVRKGRWTEEEDRILLEAYERLGPAWNEIANLIPGRKDDQCSKRHRGILGPLAKNRLSDWTQEEDQILRDGVRDLGHRWTSVAARLPGRPPLTCRNRWRNLCKQVAAPAPPADQDPSPGSAQPTQESDTPGQSASPSVSRESSTLNTPFNFQDPVVTGAHDLPGSLINSPHVPAGVGHLDEQYVQLPFDHLTTHDQLVDNTHSSILNSASNFEVFPNMGFAEPNYWNTGPSLDGPGLAMTSAPGEPALGEQHMAPTSMAGPVPGEPALGEQEMAPTSMAGPASTQAPTLSRQGPGAETSGNLLGHADPDYTNLSNQRALELAAEMASRSSQQLPNIAEEPRNDAEGMGSFAHSTIEAGDSLLYPGDRNYRQPAQHHYHHHHHYHHYYHHHHHHHHHN